MRTIGRAEEALEKMVKRLNSRIAFGKKIIEHSEWEQRIAEARIEIEMKRLLCLKAADMMDKVGNKTAQLEIAVIKVAAPRMVTRRSKLSAVPACPTRPGSYATTPPYHHAPAWMAPMKSTAVPSPDLNFASMQTLQ